VPSLRDLRNRIRATKNTQQITRAMKQVAAAKIRRADTLQKQSRPYAEALRTMLQQLLAAVGQVNHPFMKPGTAGAPTGVILMTADKGLAGSFNSNVIRLAEQLVRNHVDARWYPVGNKARNAVRRLGQETVQAWPLQNADKLAAAREIAKQVSTDFVEGRITKLNLISSRMVNVLSQVPETRQLLPIERTVAAAPQDGPRGAVEFEPSPEAVLSLLMPKYLEFTIYAAMLETDVAFYAAQLTAMTNASDNAAKLIDELTVEMNNARQAAITKEILEIVGGAEALAG
jgi:F-type H+-transporting ATPase subunit gamma